MKFVVLIIVAIAILIGFVDQAQSVEDPEAEWRPEAQRVALEALAKKYPRIVAQDVEPDIYRYSTSSVLERTAHAFSFLITPDKSRADLTYRCDIIISRYRGQVYSFVFGEPTCYQVECTEDEVPYKKRLEKFCRQP